MPSLIRAALLLTNGLHTVVYVDLRKCFADAVRRQNRNLMQCMVRYLDRFRMTSLVGKGLLCKQLKSCSRFSTLRGNGGLQAGLLCSQNSRVKVVVECGRIAEDL